MQFSLKKGGEGMKAGDLKLLTNFRYNFVFTETTALLTHSSQ
jgi:hypothetical protein